METLILSSSLFAATTAVIVTVFSFKDRLYTDKKNLTNNPEVTINLLEREIRNLRRINEELQHQLANKQAQISQFAVTDTFSNYGRDITIGNIEQSAKKDEPK